MLTSYVHKNTRQLSSFHFKIHSETMTRCLWLATLKRRFVSSCHAGCSQLRTFINFALFVLLVFFSMYNRSPAMIVLIEQLPGWLPQKRSRPQHDFVYEAMTAGTSAPVALTSIHVSHKQIVKRHKWIILLTLPPLPTTTVYHHIAAWFFLTVMPVASFCWGSSARRRSPSCRRLICL